jgi:hypothetical protein
VPIHPCHIPAIRLFLGNLDGSIVDTLDDLVGVLAVNGASDRLGRAEDLLDGTGEGLGERVVGKLSGNLRIQCQPVPFLSFSRSPLTSTISSNCTFPLCLMFFSFFLSRGGSFTALMTIDDAEGTTETAACRFWIVSWTVTRRPFQSPVALAMSSPTFLGDCRHFRQTISSLLPVPSLTRPKGPILGAKAAEEPTSPPTARR